MIDFMEFSDIVQEEAALLPDYAFEGLNGGIVVHEEAKLHPNRLADDLYILGIYQVDHLLGKQVVIYYGSFAASIHTDNPDVIRRRIRETLRHEIRHHLETEAGLYGTGTLIEEDWNSMVDYYRSHSGDHSGDRYP